MALDSAMNTSQFFTSFVSCTVEGDGGGVCDACITTGVSTHTEGLLSGVQHHTPHGVELIPPTQLAKRIHAGIGPFSLRVSSPPARA